MKSALVKRSLIVSGRKTSVSVEKPFWVALKEFADCHEKPIAAVVSEIDQTRTHSNLSSAIRLFVLNHCRKEARKSD